LSTHEQCSWKCRTGCTMLLLRYFWIKVGISRLLAVASW
jgi:hypothetical protein